MIQVISQLLMNHRTSYLRTANCGILADEFRTLIRLSSADKRWSVNPNRTRSVSHNKVLRSEINTDHLQESYGNFVAYKNVHLKSRVNIVYLDLEDHFSYEVYYFSSVLLRLYWHAVNTYLPNATTTEISLIPLVYGCHENSNKNGKAGEAKIWAFRSHLRWSVLFLSKNEIYFV
ncbi:hypothetical protein T03_9541 [Trichinella britovi]|uniref:Uncharacterized protein n=2 Tax=Trichinella britovi TaxID=45882 RepID=A0A0V1C3F9_TRIBR|nr:hypothetical protein T03_9541 [Trichinella britovi]